MLVPNWMIEINEKVFTEGNDHVKDILWTFWFGVPFPKHQDGSNFEQTKKKENKMKKRKLKLMWTCSDFVHHEHRFRWTAVVCGKVQYYWARLSRIFGVGP